MTYNVLDFGAKADGASLDTEAIQAASDACFMAGGGTVLIPAGKYLCGSVRLYSNTTVRIEQNARLYLCTDEAVYEAPRGKYDSCRTRDEQELMGLPAETSLNFMQKMFLAARRSHTDNMFYAYGAENIVIEGDGVIDGQYEYFFEAEVVGEEGVYETLFSNTVPRWQRRLDDGLLLPKGFRPHLVYMQECKNVRLRNLNLLNTISSGEMPPRKQACENIVVSDCIGSTYCNFFRIFNGIDADVCYTEGVATEEAINISRTQGVKNVSISNCILEEGGCFTNLVAVHGVLDHVRIGDCSVAQGGKDVAVFIAVQKEGKIQNVTFNNIDCRVKGGITIQGTDTDSISHIVFRNCRFYIETTSKLFGNGMIDPLVQYWVSDLGPYNVYIRHADDIRLIDCEVLWGEADIADIWEIADEAKRPDIYNKLWRADMDPSDSWPCITAYDVNGLCIHGFRGIGFGGADVIKVENVCSLDIE